MKKTLVALAALAAGASAQARDLPCGAQKYSTTITLVENGAVVTSPQYIPYCDLHTSLRSLAAQKGDKRAAKKRARSYEPVEERDVHSEVNDELTEWAKNPPVR